jgi:formylglycine-generating enzyme required for sulfatase activity
MPISDTGLSHLKGLTNLEALFLGEAAVTDDGLQHLQSLKKLDSLTMGGTKISGTGLVHLKGLPQLKTLNLDYSTVTDAGLEHLKDFTGLTTLLVRKTKVTATGVKKLTAALPNCRIVWDGDATTTNRFTNSLGMEFALIPKGKAWLGGGGGKVGDKEVELKDDFYFGVYEVTREEWETVMGIQFFKPAPQINKRDPVERVSWDACQRFVTLLSAQTRETGWVYRLPTELEWEYACRGGPMADKFDGAFDFYFDKPVNTLAPGMANFSHGEGSRKRVCTVGTYKPNRLGLYDMHGNVMEWCQDEAPPDPKDPKAAARRVLRGGSWWVLAEHCQAGASATLPGDPGWKEHIGFRVARVRVAADPDRRAAEWVLSIGGRIRINGQDDEIIAAEVLPQDAFELTAVDLGKNPQATDAGLTNFKGCQNLTELVLNHTPVSDVGLVHFRECKNLTSLNLGGTLAGDIGLGYFRDCKNLTSLDLRTTHLTDAGLVHFKDCKNLSYLSLARSRVTDAGMAHFKDCLNLTTLSVWETQVTDEGLRHLKNCRNLRTMDLRKTQVSDAGVEQLEQLKALEVLSLHQAKVTAEGVKKLATALPACRIEWDGGVIDPTVAADRTPARP